MPGFRLRDVEVHSPDQTTHRLPARTGSPRKAAVLQPVCIAGLSPTSSPARKPSHIREQRDGRLDGGFHRIRGPPGGAAASACPSPEFPGFPFEPFEIWEGGPLCPRRSTREATGIPGRIQHVGSLLPPIPQCVRVQPHKSRFFFFHLLFPRRRAFIHRLISADVDVVLELAALQLGKRLPDLGAGLHQGDRVRAEAASGMPEFVPFSAHGAGVGKERRDLSRCSGQIGCQRADPG
jgi:hypothetical protein